MNLKIDYHNTQKYKKNQIKIKRINFKLEIKINFFIS